MAKIIFKTFQEAAAFSKNLAITSKKAISIHRDGDSWWADDGFNEFGYGPPPGIKRCVAKDEILPLAANDKIHILRVIDPKWMHPLEK